MKSLLKRFYEKIVFFLHFFKNPIKLSTPMTTCSGIHEEIKKQVGRRKPRTVIELGAGVGTVTEHILEALPEDGQVLCIEQEQAFCDRLSDRFDNRVEVIQGDAVDLGKLVENTRWADADAIISTVPLIIDRSEELCGQIRSVLKDDGLYLQVANLPGPMKEHFDIEESWFYPTNIPPERLHLASARARKPSPEEEKKEVV